MRASGHHYIRSYLCCGLIMTINYNLKEFYAKPVEDFSAETGISTPKAVTYRLRLDWESHEAGMNLGDVVDQFAADPNVDQIRALVLGSWGSDDSSGLVAALVRNRGKLNHLEALMFGDITYEEQEISWIQQSDLNGLFGAFPNLQVLRTRGGNNLSFGDFSHEKLKTLIVESGGLPTNVIREILAADLPNLEHLEIWFGSEDYGFDATIEDIRPFLDGTKWPKLKYLGLRDSTLTNDIAAALDGSGVLDQLKVLDLSLGTLNDVGAETLFNTANISNLDKIDLHHHYVSDAWMLKLRKLDVLFDLADQQEEDDEYRYVAVAE